MKIALRIDDQMAANRARRRAPGFDDRGDNDCPALAFPAFGDGQGIYAYALTDTIPFENYRESSLVVELGLAKR